jgi:hypothetical protein
LGAAAKSGTSWCGAELVEQVPKESAIYRALVRAGRDCTKPALAQDQNLWNA